MTRYDTVRFEQHATRAAFFIPGFVVACWAPLVPFAKARNQLDDAMLGAVLLCLGVGSLVAMPVAGALAARVGCRAVMTMAVIVMLATFPLLSVAPTPWSLAAVLVVFGAAMGGMDCVMNVQAVTVERASGRSMMSGFHAYYSVGCLAGATFMAILLGAGMGIVAASCSAVALVALIAAVSQQAWRSDKASRDAPTFAMPRGVVVAIGAVCFVTFLAEGAILDWSAVFLHEVKRIDLAHAGWGFVSFNLAMTATRLVGDRIIERVGQGRAVLIGGLVAGSGLALATWTPQFTVSLIGYGLVGVGCANIVPVMFTLAGRQTTMPESVAFPAVTSMAYLGVLAGPALIGFIGKGWSLPSAFFLVSVGLTAAAMVGRHLSSAVTNQQPNGV